MLYRVAAVAFLACVLAGCTDADWDHTLSYVGVGERPVQQAPAAPAPAQAVEMLGSKSGTWCDGAARAAAQESREQGFDEATQRRQAESARRQCLRS